MKATPRHYDVFISYRHTQKAGVKAFCDYLDKARVVYYRDENARELFSDINADIIDALRKSKLVLVWYSADYLQSRACAWEFFTALAVGVNEGALAARLVCIAPNNIFDHIIAVKQNAKMLGEQSQWLQLAEEIASVAANVAKPMGKRGDLKRFSSTWYGRTAESFPSWVGRYPKLIEVHEQLHRGAVIDRENQGSVVIYGRGGAGKTMLALEYANRFQACYPGGIVFLSSADEKLVSFGADETQPFRTDAVSQIAAHDDSPLLKSLRDQLRIIYAEVLETTSVVETAEQTEILRHLERSEPLKYIKSVKTKIDALLAKRGRYLWIVDDLIDDSTRQLWLPITSVKNFTLVTMRSEPQLASNFRKIELRKMSNEEARSLLDLQASASPSDGVERAQQDEVIAELDGLPLMLALAGAYIKTLPEPRRYSEFIEHLRTPDNTFELDRLMAELSGDLPTGHRKSIAWTIKRSIDQLVPDGAALFVLRLLAISFPQPLSKRLLGIALAAFKGPTKNVEAGASLLKQVDLRLHGLALVLPVETDTALMSDARGGADHRIHALIAKTLLWTDTQTPFKESVLGTLVNALQTFHTEIDINDEWNAIRRLCEQASRVSNLLPQVVGLVASLRTLQSQNQDFSMAAGMHQICRSVLLGVETLHGQYREQRYKKGESDSDAEIILRNIGGESLTIVASGYYEIPHLKSAVRVLFEFQRNEWNSSYESKLIWHDDHEDFVATYAIAEAKADLYMDYSQLNDQGASAKAMLAELTADVAAHELIRRETAGYALAQIYGEDSTKIDLLILERWTRADEYIERMIFGELLVNLALNRDEILSDIMSAEWFGEYARRQWNYLEIDLQEIQRIPALLDDDIPKTPDAWWEPLQAAADLRKRLEKESKASELGKLRAYQKLVKHFYSLGNRDELIDNFVEGLSQSHGSTIYLQAIEKISRLLLLHPLWSVGERATSMLAKAVSLNAANLQIIARLLEDTRYQHEDAAAAQALWRQAYGSVDASFNARGYDEGRLFREAVKVHYKHPNSRVRGICIENLSAMVRESSPEERRELIKSGFGDIVLFWLQHANDCWELELLYLLLRFVDKLKIADLKKWIAGKTLSHYFPMQATRPFYRMERQEFLHYIESIWRTGSIDARA